MYSLFKEFIVVLKIKNVNMETLTIIKVGGKIVESPESLEKLLMNFSKIKGYKALVHGGGVIATDIAKKLGIESQMIEGKRVTYADMLQVVTMVYSGVNMQIVAGLQAIGVNAIGLNGADMNCIMSEKRPVGDVDYGFVGDVKQVNADALANLIKSGIVPVLAPLTHDRKGQILNTNADTIASEVAKALAKYFEVTLEFCFDKKGVLRNVNDNESVIPIITKSDFAELLANGIIQEGMIPKLENAFRAIDTGVMQVIITQAEAIHNLDCGTKVIK